VRLRAPFVILAAAALLGGCSLFGRDKSTAEPPAELVRFDPTIEVRRLWSTRIGGSSEQLRLALRPSSDGMRVYAGARDGKVQALDAQTGRAVWSVNTRLPLSAGPAYGAGLLAFGTTSGQLLLLDAETGEERWRRPVGSEVLAPPAIGGTVVTLRTVDGRLRGFSTRDGSESWSVEQTLPALTLRGHTSPHVAGQLVVTGFDNGRIGVYQVATGDPVWELPIATPTGRNELDRLVDISGSVQVVGNDVYAVGYQGRAVSVDLNTGLVLWEREMSSVAGLDVDLTRVYVTNDVGGVVALNRQGGTPIWSQDALRLRDVTAPTRFRNSVVVGDFEGYLHWLGLDNGEFIARTKAGSARVSWAPLVVGNSIVVQSDDGRVSAFTIVDDETA
jgi:outer membrane protein assembly factor BamB